ncbi:hypothetical protein B0H13DRAFT_240647 [Mycena leptocephala]|nr:hypothetical protein B0H13DRAFT_240647 [Mycena leptocephala]
MGDLSSSLPLRPARWRPASPLALFLLIIFRTFTLCCSPPLRPAPPSLFSSSFLFSLATILPQAHVIITSSVLLPGFLSHPSSHSFPFPIPPPSPPSSTLVCGQSSSPLLVTCYVTGAYRVPPFSHSHLPSHRFQCRHHKHHKSPPPTPSPLCLIIGVVGGGGFVLTSEAILSSLPSVAATIQPMFVYFLLYLFYRFPLPSYLRTTYRVLGTIPYVSGGGQSLSPFVYYTLLT